MVAHVSTWLLRMATEGTANAGSSEPPAGAQIASATTGQPHLAVQDLKTLVSLLAAVLGRMQGVGEGMGRALLHHPLVLTSRKLRWLFCRGTLEYQKVACCQGAFAHRWSALYSVRTWFAMYGSLDFRPFWLYESLGNNLAWKCLPGMPWFLNSANLLFS